MNIVYDFLCNILLSYLAFTLLGYRARRRWLTARAVDRGLWRMPWESNRSLQARLDAWATLDRVSPSRPYGGRR